VTQPVWTLSVDLQTKTATFTSGMSDAAKGARSSFSEIKEGAREMGRETSGSMMEARHGVMLLGEEFGIRLPRALTSFIASIGPVGAAMEAAFPFLAILVGATLLIEHLVKLKEQGDKLSESQVQFGTTVANVLNGLDNKLLEAGIRTDELNHNHLGALNKQLELIDHQSMQELVHAFDTVAKSADVTFAQLKTSWYTFGSGSAGAKHALDEFKTKYDSLIAQGKDKDAADLLAGTRQSAERVLELQKQIRGPQEFTDSKGNRHNVQYQTDLATVELQKQRVGWTTKEVEAQQILVDALNAQLNVESKVQALKEAKQGNTKTEEANKEVAEQEKIVEAQQRGLAEYLRHRTEAENRISALRKKAEHEEEELGMAELHANDAFLKAMKEEEIERAKLAQESSKEDAGHGNKMAELQIAADREAAQMRMAQGRMSEQEMLDMELLFNAQEYNAKKQALNQELAALDTFAKDYEIKKKALNDRLLELDRTFENQDQKILDDANRKNLAGVQSAETRMRDAYASGFAGVIMGKQSFVSMMQQMDTQIATNALKNAMESLMQIETVQGRKRFGDARTAAADAYASAGNPVLGAIEAAGAFAAVLAFAEGGIVPGVEMGDVVPARLTPGETVIPKQMTERLNKASGDSDSNRPHMHVHHNPMYHIHAIDGASVRSMLNKHKDEFSRHFHREIRRMNK